jgi:DNA polymerase
MGRIAAHHLLGHDASIASLRGKPQTLRIGLNAEAFEVPALVTYHPAYLLRNPEDKAKAWEDLNRFAELLRQH